MHSTAVSCAPPRVIPEQQARSSSQAPRQVHKNENQKDRAGEMVQWAGCLPCKWLTQDRTLAPHMILRILSTVLRVHRDRSKPATSKGMIPKQQNPMILFQVQIECLLSYLGNFSMPGLSLLPYMRFPCFHAPDHFPMFYTPGPWDRVSLVWPNTMKNTSRSSLISGTPLS